MKSHRIALALPMLLAALFSASYQARAEPAVLDPLEAAIVAHADAAVASFANDLEEAVGISSATEDIAGVTRMGALIAGQLRELGFDTRWVPLPPETGRAGHVVAERRGTRGKRLLLIGHLDTVLPGGNFRLDGQRASGSGAADMKGGNLVAIHALRALHAAGALDDTRIIAVFTGDEEAPGSPLEVVRRDLIEAAQRSDVALGFENAIRDTVTVARRGSLSWTLETRGISAHSSGIFSPFVGAGAIYEAARILNAFREELRDEEGLTFNAALIAGGTTATAGEFEGRATGKKNITAGRAVVNGDLRALDQAQVDRVQARMREIVGRHLPQTSASIRFHEDGYPPMAATPGNHALHAALDQASRDLGFGPVKVFDPRGRGAGDISFAAPYVPSLDGLGIRGEWAHNPAELAQLDSVPELVKRTAVLIYRLTRQPGAPE